MAARTIRPIRIEGNVAYVPITKGLEAVIDATDAALVIGVNWTANVNRSTTYAYRMKLVGAKWVTIRMHRLIIGAAAGDLVDHIDGNGLNNRRSNLRIANHQENGRNARLSRSNASGQKGASWDRTRGKWQAQIRAGGQKINLGRFDTRDEAHAAYVRAAQRYYGEFANAG